jgi:hypothetical protein
MKLFLRPLHGAWVEPGGSARGENRFRCALHRTETATFDEELVLHYCAVCLARELGKKLPETAWDVAARKEKEAARRKRAKQSAKARGTFNKGNAVASEARRRERLKWEERRKARSGARGKFGKVGV